MFGLLNSSQIYGLHQAETNSNNSNSNHYSNNNNNSNNHNNIICNRQSDKLSNSSGGMKISANFLEKFIKSEVIAGAALDIRNGYDAVKNLKNFHNQNNSLNNNSNTSSNLNGNYRHHHNHTNGCETTDNMTNPIKTTTNCDNNKGTNSCSRKTGRKLNADKDKDKAKDKEQIDDGNSNDVISELKIFDRQSGSSSVPSSSTVSSSSSTESPGAERKIPATAMDTTQRKKFIQMVAFLDHQNQRLQKELAKEKRRRAEELSRIIKSLLCFEAKLKVDKKLINQKLLEKDNEICRLVSLNRALMKKCNGEQLDDSLGDQQECDVMEALQCMTCKKDFYGIESKDSWAQTGKEGRNISDDHTTEHGSSSDDTLSSSFYGARRSIRYTSKRTFGTFRDYMRSRSMNIDDLNLDNSEENTSTISRDDSQNSYEKMNVFSRTIDRMHGVRRVSSFEGDLDSENDNNSRRSKSKTCSNSSGVDEDEHMHSPGQEEEDEVFVPKSVGKVGNPAGRRVKGFLESSPQQAFETSTDDWYASASEPEEAESVRSKPYGYNAVNPVLECVNQILLQQSMEECLNDSPTSLEGSEHNSNASSGAISGGNTGSGNVSSTSSLSSGKENNNGTVGRKRVHFSTKNSMVHVPRDDDNSMPTQLPSASVIAEQIKDNILNYESIYSNEYEPIGSEQNSSNLYVDMETKLGQEDRRATEKPKQPPALPPKPANLMKFKRVTKPSSIRSQSPHTEQPVTIKDDDKSVISEPDYCSISEVNMAVTSVKIIADVHKIPDDTSIILRDEISDPQISTILSPQKTYEIEEIFADIPKLPNVAAIIAPKTPTKLTSNDNNYVSPTLTTNSHHHSIYQQQQRSLDDPLKPKSPRQIKRKHVPNILAEINKRMNNSNVSTTILSSVSPNSTPTKISQSPKKLLNHPLTSIIKLNSNSNVVSSSPLNSPPITSDKLPLQAEFDWYNLDAEYGKSPNQPDVIQPSDTGIIEEINEFDVGENDSNLMHPIHGVEYNLDEEFSLSNQPDIIKENVLEQKLIDEENANNLIDTQNQLQQIQSLSPPLSPPLTTATTPITISDSFPIITDTTPCTKKIKTQNFDSFLDNSGLSSKPLPRQRKIYFAGPFV